MKKQKSWFAEHPVWTGVLGLILLVFVISSIISDNPQQDSSSSQSSISKPKTTPQEIEYTLEHKLAIINVGYPFGSYFFTISLFCSSSASICNVIKFSFMYALKTLSCLMFLSKNLHGPHQTV